MVALGCRMSPISSNAGSKQPWGRPEPRRDAYPAAARQREYSEAARRHADLVIKPHAEGDELLEFHQLDTAREAGRAAARKALELAPTGPLAARTCR